MNLSPCSIGRVRGYGWAAGRFISNSTPEYYLPPYLLTLRLNFQGQFMLYPIILAGGTGTRLWPVSRTALPKQFVEFFPGQGSLFEATLNRLQGLPGFGPPVIVCGEDQRFLVAETLKQLDIEGATIVLEPLGRNTAPAIAMAALLLQQRDPQAQLLVLPADHVIENVAAFQQSISAGISLVAEDWLVTFGIVPGAPVTGYGYLRQGKDIANTAGKIVAEFVEKPDEETAKIYVESGEYFWNSGMFLFAASSYLKELANYAQDIFESCQSAYAGLEQDRDFCRIPEAEFASCRSESVDYAVMEKTDRAAMIPLNAGWNDLGAWNAVWEHAEKDSDGNHLQGDVLASASTDSYVLAQSRLVATLGIRDLVVVETPDVVLVADRHQAQQVKTLVEQLQQNKRKEKDFHSLVYRPWGSFESLAQGEGYQVKHIVVNPGAAISLQRHQRRSEHWTVVKGSAQVHCDGKEFALRENESTFIPLGSKHRLSNPGVVPVEIIEVQVGAYLGEDDIERFEDLYGR